jgi:large subunit ribosomal protein L10
MNKDQKAAVIDEVAAQIEEADAVFAVDYRGLSVPQAAELREKLAEADATLRVVKNTLTLLAADKAGAEDLKDHLEGPTAFAFVRGDAALAAKAIATFRREHEFPEFKGGRMNGEVVSVEEIQEIARLPALDVLRGQFVGVLASPVTGLVRGLGSLIQGLALQLKSIEDQGLVGGDAPAPEPEPEPEPEAEAPAEEQPAAEEAPAAEEETPTEEQASGEEPAGDSDDSEAPSEGDAEDKEG